MSDVNFGTADFVVFIITLVASAVIGIYFAYADRRKKTTSSYMFGDRKLSPYAVAMSLSVTFTSAITVIAMPVEVYLYGVIFVWAMVGNIMGTIFSMVYFIPLFFNLQLNTIFEYLELRFHRSLRLIVAVITNFHYIFYMGITVYLPALALSAVTPLKLNPSIALTSFLCTFYTTLGGMKAVIWTDVLQAFIMVLGSVSVFIKVAITLGGFGNAWEAVQRGGRDNILQFTFDPRVRTSILSLVIGYFIFAINGLGASQAMIQRCLCCRSIGKARLAISIKVGMAALFLLITVAGGLAMYAYYEGCDPLLAGQIAKPDQTMPLLVVSVFKDVPGMAGIFVAAAYSGTLSTVSSGLNAIATVIINDFVLVFRPKTSDRMQLILSKVASLFAGLLVTCVAFIASLTEGTIITLSFAILGTLGPPILSLFYYSFFPFVNTKGAVASVIGGVLMGGWVSIGSLAHPRDPALTGRLSLSTDLCNFTDLVNVTTAIPHTVVQTVTATPERPQLADTLYSLSPYYYPVYSLTLSLFIGITVSLITGKQKPEDCDPKLFVPLVTSSRLPSSVVKFFRFGVPECSSDYSKVLQTTRDTDGKDIKLTDYELRKTY